MISVCISPVRPRKTLTMAEPTIAHQIPPNPDLSSTSDDFDAIPIPPIDPTIFSDDLALPDNFISFDADVEGIDFTFDDLYLPSDIEDFLNTLPGSLEPPGSNLIQIASDLEPGSFDQGFSDPELCHISGDQSTGDARVLHSVSPEFFPVSGVQSSDISKFLNVSSPESGGFNGDCSRESGNKGSDVAAVLNCPSPESDTRDREVSGPASSQASGNCGSAVSETLNYPSPDSGNCVRSVASSPNSGNNSLNGVVDQKIKLEELSNNCLLKRKKESEDVNSELRTSKYRRSTAVESVNQSYGSGAANEEGEKRKARLLRNRESAQLSRQRKKHYVEELEDKVRTMHSTIQNLNAKISYIMAENASLRQQVGGGGMCPPPVPPPGMYPHPSVAPMPYPWMPCPPYVMKPQGSQVPLVPIPRLKPQQLVSTSKAKKVESKKTEGKTKKVASVSFLGVLFFVLLFGGLVPMVNVQYRGVRDTFTGGSDYFGNGFYDQHRGRVLSVEDHSNGTNHNIGIGLPNVKDYTNGRSHVGGGESKIGHKERPSCPLPCSDDFVHLRNASEPLVASLYVPRNDKLVKIDGNLIIHSVLASEKAMASRETGLTVAQNLGSAIAIPGVGRNNGRHPHLYRSPAEPQRALASGSADNDNLKSTAADGKLQQWFREGLAGPLLSSGMCTEVFQFDVSPASAPGAIIPATAGRNISVEHRQNSIHHKGRNRRILHGVSIPLPGSGHNITKENVGRNSGKEDFRGNNSVSSMVVSVLVDPREAAEGDGEGVMGPKSLSRIFVVVLIDSVKYVTYSCMLPLKGSSHHLVMT